TPHMPPDQPKLPDETLAVIRKWIADGAPLNADSKPQKTAAAQQPAAPHPPITHAPSETPMPDAAPRTLAPAPPRPVAATAIAASPAAPLVAVCGAEQIALYHDNSGELLAALPFPEGRIERLQFSPDGLWLLAAGGQPERSGRVVIFDVRSGERLFEIGRMYDVVLAAACDPFRELVAYGGSNRVVRVFDTLTGKTAYELRKHNEWITSLAFSPDATLLATADRAGGLFVWEALTGRFVFELRGHDGAIHALAFSPDSQTLLSAGDDGVVRMWNMDDGRKIRQFNAHAGAVLSIDVAPDGRLVTSGADRRVKLWEPGGKAMRTLPELEDWAYSAAFSSDAARVYAGDWCGNVEVFDCGDGERKRRFTTTPAAPQSN
ncbi:MAG: WD40 repeat domain-containing protein, partial [Planctomycetota bacterium]